MLFLNFNSCFICFYIYYKNEILVLYFSEESLVEIPNGTKQLILKV